MFRLIGNLSIYFNEKNPLHSVSFNSFSWSWLLIGNTVIQPGDELNWSAHFPDEVPEYIDGEIRELNIVDPEMSRFENEVTAIVDETSYEEFIKIFSRVTG